MPKEDDDEQSSLHANARGTCAATARPAAHARAALVRRAGVGGRADAHAHAQNNNAGAAGNNGAQGKGQPGAADNANGAPPRKTAAQRTQEDSQRLLGGPSALQDGYATYDASPDAQRNALLNSERMRVAKPNTQQAGGPVAAGGNGGGQPAGGAHLVRDRGRRPCLLLLDHVGIDQSDGIGFSRLVL
ncbi:hypothetical protein, partial [Paraburkholderia bengalensis]|uniref:hypothetical protein n=1 Tax=Paraburkholderia bengalensis TaxID=2747562 RepID=UPI0030145BD2